MKKSTLILALAMSMLSCSKDDADNCQQKMAQINQYYATQIKYVQENPGPGGVDQSQIELLKQERNMKLAEACN